VHKLIAPRRPLEDAGRLLADPGPGIKHVVRIEGV
jgi:hypothetical protein